MSIKRRYTALLALLFAGLTLTSCVDDELVYAEEQQPDLDLPEEFSKGYSLSLVVTLDKMGGGITRATGDAENNPLSYIDDYVDPEKFRVLFFDNQERFLFESKSRWIKQLGATGDYSQWLVSVPMFSFGNDIGYNWNWEEIRKALTTNKFKVAILANRPEKEWYPGFTETGFAEGEMAQFIDNIGPVWKAGDTAWGAEPGKAKKVFDLHHCQYDILYHAKSEKAGYYDFIMDWKDDKKDENSSWENLYAEMKPKMGATSSWVYWGSGKGYEGVSPKDYDPDFPSENKVKYTVLPNQAHPIPMYGIQDFDPIKGWVPGTPFNLSDITAGTDTEYYFNKISLLRSLVKLELRIPKSYLRPTHVSMWYPNIYARCEPMNIWTPTDKIWKESHDNDCEWHDIMNYGPVCSDQFSVDGENRYANTKFNFQKTMSWFYGAWSKIGPDEEPRWDFNNGGTFTIDDVVDEFESSDKYKTMRYPQIFNPCIQRNKMVLCNVEGDVSDLYNDDYWHFVVYTGERNMNDPNKLPYMGKENATKEYHAYAVNWMFKDDATKQYYCIPIADYGTSTGNQEAQNCFGPYVADDISTTGTYDLPKGTGTQQQMESYGDRLKHVNSRDEMPWPLLRNHHYRITIGDSRENINYSWDFTNLSDETIKDLDDAKNNKNFWLYEDKVNSADWKGSYPKGADYAHYYNSAWTTNDNGKQLMAGANHDKVIKETANLLFSYTGTNPTAANGQLVNFEKVYKENDNYKYCLRLNSNNTTITFPPMRNGQTITIVCMFPVTAGDATAADRYIKAVGSNLVSVPEKSDDVKTIGKNGERYVVGPGAKEAIEKGANGTYKFTWRVKTSTPGYVPIEFQLSTEGSKGIAILKAWIDDAGEESNGSRATRAQKSSTGVLSVKTEDLHSKSIRFD